MDLESGMKERVELLPKPDTRSQPKVKIPISSAANLAALTEIFLKNEKGIFKSHLAPNLTCPNLATVSPTNEFSHESGATSSVRPSGDSTSSTRSQSPTPHAVGPTCRWRRSDRRMRRLNTELLKSAEVGDFKWAEKCLNNGARPNATCRKDCTTACHVAALMGHQGILLELLNRGADPYKVDVYGRTPLHLAAWAGRVECLATLLDVPEDIFMGSNKYCNKENATDNILDYFKRFEEFGKEVTQNIDAVCMKNDLKPVVRKNCRDSLEHECLGLRKLMPFIPGGYTPLHAACSMVQYDCVRVLMAAGAKLDSIDFVGRTALDSVGNGLVDNDAENNTEKLSIVSDKLQWINILRIKVKALSYVGLIKALLEARSPYVKMKFKNCQCIRKLANTALHVAVELECLPAISLLLEAGAYPGCYNHAGQTALHLAIFRKLATPLNFLANMSINKEMQLTRYVDLTNYDGLTPLHVAVKELWIPGVSILLESGANVSISSDDGDTALHFASEIGDLELVDEILSIINKSDAIDCVNNAGETALFKAVINNKLNCVRTLILEGASIHIKLPCNVTMIQKAAELGHSDILKELLKIDHESNKPMIDDINQLTDNGMNALHLASYNNCIECVKLLLDSGADVRARTSCLPHFQSTALHLAVTKGHEKPTELILKSDRFTIEDIDLHGWHPLHAACYHGNRDCIALLVNAGADLSSTTYDSKRIRNTAMELLVENVSRPKEFLEKIFDSYIYQNGLNFNDPNCEVKVDYSILMSKKCNNEQMPVIVALLNTGNRFEQKKLLLHPLIESYLYLKWNALSTFFYGILVFYALFIIALTSLVFSLYYLKDIKSKPPGIFFINISKYTLFITISCILVPEFFYMKQNIGKYFLKFETWVKLGSFGTSIAFALIEHHVENDWPRHITTIAVLLAWTEVMFLLSRFPNWGYYLLMFSKVAINVIKVLVTFVFLLVGFTIAFMLQFHSLPPFDTPWTAMVKILVMMTSEYDYMSLFDDEPNNATSMVVGRIMFVVFLVLASVVLMNLMVGLAVSDITDLEIHGKIQRLTKQVDFLESLDSFVYKSVIKLLSKRLRNRLLCGRNIDGALTIYPGRPLWRHYGFIPAALKEAIIAKASEKKIKADETIALNLLSAQVKEIYEIVKQNRTETKYGDVRRCSSENEGTSTPRKYQLHHDEVIEIIKKNKDEVVDVKKKFNKNITDSGYPVSDIHQKLDTMHKEIDCLGTMLKKILEKSNISLNLPSQM